MFPRSFHIQFKACFESFKRNKSILFSTTDYFLICYFLIIVTLHKEGKSQRVITERCGSSQSALSNHIKCKVDWNEEIG